MSKPQRMLISSDKLVPKPFRGAPASRAQRFYNWSEDGNHPPLDKFEVPFDEWHLEMAVAGLVTCDGPEDAKRFVDQRRRDKQLETERKCGWHNLTAKQRRAMFKPEEPKEASKPKPAPKAPKDSD